MSARSSFVVASALRKSVTSRAVSRVIESLESRRLLATFAMGDGLYQSPGGHGVHREADVYVSEQLDNTQFVSGLSSAEADDQVAQLFASGYLVEGPREGDDPWIVGYDRDGLAVARGLTPEEEAGLGTTNPPGLNVSGPARVVDAGPDRYIQSVGRLAAGTSSEAASDAADDLFASGYLVEGPREGDDPWIIGYDRDGQPVMRTLTPEEEAGLGGSSTPGLNVSGPAQVSDVGPMRYILSAKARSDVEPNAVGVVAEVDDAILAAAEDQRAQLIADGYLVEGPRKGDDPWVLGYDRDGLGVMRALTAAEEAALGDTLQPGQTFGALTLNGHSSAMHYSGPATPPTTAARVGGPLDIVVNRGSALNSNNDAKATLDQAVAYVESLFADSIVDKVYLDVNFGALDTNVNAEAVPEFTSTDYSTLRSNMVADVETSDDALVNQLPTSAPVFGFDTGYPVSSTYVLTHANALAIGNFQVPFVSSAYVTGAPKDANLTFNNSAGRFDFTTENGIDSGKISFHATAVHEILHALGFISIANQSYALSLDGDIGTIFPSAADLFRLKVTQDRGSATFSTVARIAHLGSGYSTPVLYDGQFDPAGISGLSKTLGTGDIPMSTGTDGRQPAHFKDDDITGRTIGNMDPTRGTAIQGNVKRVEQRLLDLFGWDADINAGHAIAQDGDNGVTVDAYGTSAADTITVSEASDVVTVNINGTKAFFSDVGVNDVLLDGQGSNDTLTATNYNQGVTMSGGSGTDTLTGSAYADGLNGKEGGDNIGGFAGNDTLAGNEGNDTLSGGDGDDLLVGKEGNDTIYGGGGSRDLVNYDHATAGIVVSLNDLADDTEVIGGTSYTDNVGTGVEDIGGSGYADRLTGYTTANKLRGNGGNDTIDGSGGTDSLYGGSGNDKFYAQDSAVDYVFGDDGTDSMFTQDASDVLDSVP